MEEVYINGYTFERISLPGCGSNMETGFPELPVINKLIAIPGKSDVKVNLVDYSEMSYHNLTIFPYQTPTLDRNIIKGFDWDYGFYNSNAPYPKKSLNVGMPSIMRDLRVVNLTINPFTYYPGQGLLVVKNHIMVEVSFEGENSINILERNNNIPVSPRWEKIYNELVLNYDMLNLPSGEMDGTGVKFLIITHPNFTATINTLATWHHKSGLKTEVVSLNTTDPAVVKNEIISRYDSGTLDYVLLVGDTGYMPTYTAWGVTASDHWYACISGAPDLYPDLAVGRLSCTTTAGLSAQVTKIMKYMKNPPASSWLKKTLLVAHKEGAPGKYVGCKEEIRTTILPGFGWTTYTAYGNEAAGTNANVTNYINSGINVLNYRGHGDTQEWWCWDFSSTSFTNANVTALTNGDMTPVVFNIACTCGNITSYCLIECWLDANDGACAALGASQPSYTDANHAYDKALYQAFVTSGIYEIGYVSNFAANAILPSYGSYGETNTKMYLWCGDPATDIWTSIPVQLHATHSGVIKKGLQKFAVKVVNPKGAAVSGARVCVYKGTQVYGVGTTNASGSVTFGINPTTTGTMYVTASKHNYLPDENTVSVTL
jgi:hypothetical protein